MCAKFIVEMIVKQIMKSNHKILKKQKKMRGICQKKTCTSLT